MATRKLGGGRILGSGKGLAPPTPLSHRRTTSLLSPSESTASVDSNNSASPPTTSPLPESEQDISSVVQLGQDNGATAEAITSKLMCPICNEEMMTLLQLNRHLDDDHQELPPVEQDEVKNWFEKQVTKAKKFQPLAVINQKLKGLEVFEPNGAVSVPTTVTSTQVPSRSTVTEVRQPDPDEVVTRKHWQKHGYNDLCTEPSCGKRLGTVNGSVNCRKCGKLFCEDHTMYQMKLSRSAQHEPVRGFWCRVCETCYKSRDGYNDHNGYVRDHMADFNSMRRKRVDKQTLETSRLEKRLTKVTQLLANPPEDANIPSGGIFSPAKLTGQSDPRKILEQSVVVWEEDAKVVKCPFCQQIFGSWSFRRHHCRICGRVVCADLATGCSSEVGLSVISKKTGAPLSIDVRMCRDCKTTIFSKSDFASELSHKPPDQRSYENLLEFERGIRLLLARFQKALVTLQDPDHPPSHTQLAEASRTRKKLIEFFGKYDILAKRLRDLPTKSATQERLQKAIYQQASNFLHLHMLPLKSLPKILKHASPHGNTLQNGTNSRGGALASIKFNDIESSSQISSEFSALEAEEKELRERLIVMEEQKFLVSEMIADANKRRKFDEVSSLSMSLEDLSREIDTVTGQLSQLDFAGAYNHGTGGVGNVAR